MLELSITEILALPKIWAYEYYICWFSTFIYKSIKYDQSNGSNPSYSNQVHLKEEKKLNKKLQPGSYSNRVQLVEESYEVEDTGLKMYNHR